MPFRSFLEHRRRERAASDLYLKLVEQAREPIFYVSFGVPDTLEARFDMIILHAWLLLRRLGAVNSEAAKALSQATFDLMFADMDRNLREMGVTDLRVGKRVQKMAEAFYGRASAYDRGLADGGDALGAALARNLYQGETVAADHLDAMIAYINRQVAHLDTLADPSLLDGNISFLSPEARA
jgi:cytochrome b pre-mRNA-processing protein 3